MWKDMDTEQQGINGAKIFVTGVTIIPHLPAITINLLYLYFPYYTSTKMVNNKQKF